MGHQKLAYPVSLTVLAAIFLAALSALAIVATLFEELALPAVYALSMFAAASTILFLAAGFAARPHDAQDFENAGGSLPPVSGALASLAATLPPSALFSAAGLAFLLGYDGLAFGLGWAGGLALAAIAIAPPLRASGAETMCHYFALRYAPFAGRIAAVVVLIVSLVLLVAEISFAGAVGERLSGIASRWWTIALLLTALLIALPAGLKSLAWAGTGQSIALIAAFTVPLVFLSLHSQGSALPLLSFGQTLDTVTALETTIVEQGLADFDSFSPNVTPFLKLDTLTFFAITLCLLTGTAALPHILGRFPATRSRGEAHLSAAWTAALMLLILLAIPAYSNLVKSEIYGLIAKETPLEKLPSSFEQASQLDILRIHGASLGLLRGMTAAEVANSEMDKSAGASGKAKANPAAKIEAPMRAAAAAAAKRKEVPGWDEFRTKVLPKTARAAGNESGILSHASLSIEPLGIMVLAPALANVPIFVWGLLLVGAIAAVLATAGALLLTMAFALFGRGGLFASGSFPRGRDRFAVLRGALLASAAVAGTIALRCQFDVLTAVLAAFSIAAGALFAPLILGLNWRRANAAGAIAGLTTGLLVTLAYLGGTQLFPVELYEAAPGFSNAGEGGVLEYESLVEAWREAPPGEAQDEARAALESEARGSLWQPGVANWFGLHGSLAALLGLPASLMAVLALGLIIPSRGRKENEPNQ